MDIDWLYREIPKESVKGRFGRLDQICPGHTLLASNTSVLSVTDLAAVTKRPNKFLGMYLSNPVPLMKGLELVRAVATWDETMAIAKEVGKTVGKVIDVAKDAPGFISNWILTPFLLNAVRVLEEGLASKVHIDTIITIGLGHPMGPLTLLDLIGIDTVFHGASAIKEKRKDPQYDPPTLMQKMVAIDWHGRKTGKGF